MKNRQCLKSALRIFFAYLLVQGVFLRASSIGERWNVDRNVPAAIAGFPGISQASRHLWHGKVLNPPVNVDGFSASKLDGLSIQESGIGGFLRRVGLDDEPPKSNGSDHEEEQTGSPSDLVVPRPRFRHGSRVGDVYGGLLVIVGAFIGFGSSYGAAFVLAFNARNRWGWFLVLIAAIGLFLTIGSGAIGCLPQDWHKCVCDGQEHN